jgi:hypothetical protein
MRSTGCGRRYKKVAPQFQFSIIYYKLSVVLNRDYSGAWEPCCREVEKKELGQETGSKGLRG